MKNTAPISSGIIAVACLFGFIGGAVSFVAYDWSFLGALFLAVIIAIIVAIILMLGWREPASAPVQAGTAGVGAGTAPTASGSGDNAASAPTPSAEEKVASVAVDPQVATDQPEVAAAAAQPTSTDTAATAAATPSAKVKAATTLAGEDELASRKGEWKYDGEGDDAPKADASAPVGSADKDYDGDGIIEGENEGSKPELLTAARDGGADNLKEIKGVGPKMENMLNDMGVYHFDQVAGWSSDEVAWVDANLKGFKGRVSRDGWVDQAKILAAGGDTEFSKKVEKGGVY